MQQSFILSNVHNAKITYLNLYNFLQLSINHIVFYLNSTWKCFLRKSWFNYSNALKYFHMKVTTILQDISKLCSSLKHKKSKQTKKCVWWGGWVDCHCMGTTFFRDIKRDRIHLSEGNCHEKKLQQNLCNKILLPTSIKIIPRKHFSVE